MIVIPMAGMSSRFIRAGYGTPKYMLPLGGRTVFDFAVGSFERLFGRERFLFVAREDHGAKSFIEEHCQLLGIKHTRTVILDEPTQGQAHTVAMGIIEAKICQDEPLTIFNIDTFRPNFEHSEMGLKADGYLEVFIGEGAGWSFVLPDGRGSTKVARTAEKDPISKYCCTGLYHFAKSIDFLQAFESQWKLEPARRHAGELYVAPLYNDLISWGSDIRMFLIQREEVIFCGTPEEYEVISSNCFRQCS